jgi:hypothetical protein
VTDEDGNGNGGVNPEQVGVADALLVTRCRAPQLSRHPGPDSALVQAGTGMLRLTQHRTGACLTNACDERALTMQPRTKWLAGGAVAVAVIGGGAGAAIAATGGDDEEPLTGSTLDTAVDAALEETGGGTVVETEAGDDGATYSVEVRLDDGRQVEVNLDRDFKVIGHEADDDSPNENENDGD